ncbi:FHA domain-containing protein FhaB/FipA [Leucobacter sp. W1153]|uniref:FHA domain-containing protein FhaB/FipA n=1 Tax=Leucobacter sp. W1153 TaxID=3439064 RepID=UPI003F33B047
MSELTLLILRIGFLLLLWLFIFAIVYALRSDLFGAPVRKLPSDGAARQPNGHQATPTPAPIPTGNTQPATPPLVSASGGAFPPANAKSRAATLVITSGVAAGTAIPLDDEMITIGRSADSTFVIVDEYTSTYHARLARNGDQWLLTDLDSTNGTKLDGTRVTGTVTVPVFTPITIGTTTFELRP